MAHVSGPTSGLPGARSASPEGMMCDDHPNVPAVKRIQGETDSMGAEYHDLCQVCLDKMNKALAEPKPDYPCDWCHTPAQLRPRRDYEEGMSGRVYHVCPACIKRDNERLAEELADDGDFY